MVQQSFAKTLTQASTYTSPVLLLGLTKSLGSGHLSTGLTKFVATEPYFQLRSTIYSHLCPGTGFLNGFPPN